MGEFLFQGATSRKLANAQPLALTHAHFVKVAVERSLDRGRTSEMLTYATSGPISIGSRVRVPLGRGDKTTEGVVVRSGGPELADGIPLTKLKHIDKLLDRSIPAELVELAEWMSTYYVCPLGMVLATMTPAAVKRDTGRKTIVQLTLTPEPNRPPTAIESLKPATRRVWDALQALELSVWPATDRELMGFAGLKSTAAIKTILAAGLLTATEDTTVRARATPGSDSSSSNLSLAQTHTRLTLTGEQAAAVSRIQPSVDAGTFGVHLLRGVTGSGKTEVYLTLIESLLKRPSGTAIVLVPEIALTPQTSSRFTQRFGTDSVAVLHSGLTAAQRNKEWSRAASGVARVVVGARSAVFAPLADLKLIIVDEEHDTSYKQDQLPRYHARDVAIKRSHQCGATVLLGSATPSLESWANTLGDKPKYTLSELTRRVPGANLPTVHIINMIDERRIRAELAKQSPAPTPAAIQHLLGPTLERAIEHTLARKGQIILLLNRRGFAHHLCCPSNTCGYVVNCTLCTANLVLHKAPNSPDGRLVRCHHCLSEQRVPSLCPVCGKKLNIFGGGTQRAEEELIAKFASMGLTDNDTLLRLDSDSMRSASDYFNALSRFERGDARMLIGTQMIAKGLDFPNVRLVGVLDADTALNTPDFRADERTFQLVSQVAGRAGRGKEAAHVILQTTNPESPAIVLAAQHDYRAFAQHELAIRKRASLPPITRMARIVCRSEDQTAAQANASTVAQALITAAAGKATIRGPVEAGIFRVAGFYRFAIDITATDPRILQATLASVRAAGLLTSDATTAVDVDPVSSF